MKICLSGFVLILIMSCTSIKSTQQAINQGDYSKAITGAIKKISKNKYSEKSKAYADLLFEAYKKNENQTLDQINFLKKDNQDLNAKQILRSFKQLKQTQDRIRPLLPLEGTKANLNFDFVNIEDRLLRAKDNYVNILFSEAIDLIETGQPLDSRNAYKKLEEVKSLDATYPELKQAMDVAYQNGLSFVLIRLANSTDMVVPKDFENSLLSLNTYDFNDFWTVYHNAKFEHVNYDRVVEVNFTEFNYSPERLLEREIEVEREVVDGWQYARDSRGNYVVDSNGDRVKEDKRIIASGLLLESIQSKEVEVKANVRFIDPYTKQIVLSRPLSSVFIFEHRFANYQGDIKALTSVQRQMLRAQFIPYPSNELMLIDAANDLKLKLKSILKNNR